MKKINGTFFEFYHHNLASGGNWNSQCREFTEEQWEAKVDEIAALGMKYIVLMESSLVYDPDLLFYVIKDIVLGWVFAGLGIFALAKGMFTQAKSNTATPIRLGKR